MVSTSLGNENNVTFKNQIEENKNDYQDKKEELKNDESTTEVKKMTKKAGNTPVRKRKKKRKNKFEKTNISPKNKK